MTKKEWDEEFSQKITELTDEIWTGSHSLAGLKRVEGKIFKEIRKDRKHQKSETLKRLPDVKDKQKYSINYVDGWNDCLAKVKDKLKGKE